MKSNFFCFMAIFFTLLVVIDNTVVTLQAIFAESNAAGRSFVIDYDNNRFLKDGQNFRYISGSIHYFRVPRIYWQDRFNKMKAAGLNAIQTYLEWSQHEPESGQYNFEDNLDVVEFIKLASQTGLLVIIRVGPYIDAEREFGGFPYWLLHEDPNMVLRTSDKTYLKYVYRWWNKVISILIPYLYSNGGPIIEIQVENEYGSYGCDRNYTADLRDYVRSLVGNDTILFTTDGDTDSMVSCGRIPEVYATVDFGPGTDVDDAFGVQRNFTPKGPYVNSEYYTGWLDLWGQPHFQVNVTAVTETLNEMLLKNASVNMYMFHGGTSFGFSSGSYLKSGDLQPCPTSYDYAAPLSEAGDPTEQYYAIRQVISKFAFVPPGPVPPPTTKKAYGEVRVQQIGTLFEMLNSVRYGDGIFTEFPQTFEALGQAYGFVLFSTVLNVSYSEPKILNVEGIRDRGYVFIDKEPVGLLSRMDGIYEINITVNRGQVLSILVENQGRVCAGSGLKDFKGIVSNVTLDGNVLTGFHHTSIPLNNSEQISYRTPNDVGNERQNSVSSFVPTFFVGEFLLSEDEDVADTFLDPTGWHKGVVFLNDFNLGRYWPVKGPQVTLFVPKDLILPYPQLNVIKILELEGAPDIPRTMKFTNIANINGTVT